MYNFNAIICMQESILLNVETGKYSWKFLCFLGYISESVERRNEFVYIIFYEEVRNNKRSNSRIIINNFLFTEKFINTRSANSNRKISDETWFLSTMYSLARSRADGDSPLTRFTPDSTLQWSRYRVGSSTATRESRVCFVKR